LGFWEIALYITIT